MAHIWPVPTLGHKSRGWSSRLPSASSPQGLCDAEWQKGQKHTPEPDRRASSEERLLQPPLRPQRLPFTGELISS